MFYLILKSKQSSLNDKKFKIFKKLEIFYFWIFSVQYYFVSNFDIEFLFFFIIGRKFFFNFFLFFCFFNKGGFFWGVGFIV
jgi:hypothetical protein